MKIHRWAAAAFCGLLLFGCSDGGETATPPAAKPPSSQPVDPPAPPAPEPPPTTQQPPVAEDPAALAKRGKTVYMSNCIACHNPDPSQDGALGPAVAGSSLELLEARVVHGTYPEGYTPKRDTKAMVALPYLEPEIGALAAYLAP